jgi:tetratricopeptide (TPR) repeat protein
MQMIHEWGERPVFISSTFRDMNAERDHLARYVFPSLEERLRPRQHDLVAIDLRWGIETISVDTEEAKEMKVLKVCLAEIDRSRPFFIGLMGDYYGWIPPAKRIATATREAQFKTDMASKSITALEIEYGVLASPDQQRRSFFYFREPLPYDKMDSQVAAIYSDAYDARPERKLAPANLQALKARIKRQLPGRVRSYQATWDPVHCKVTGLEEFGQQVLEDLWRELDQETRVYLSVRPVTWQEQERDTLEEFVHAHRRGFVGRVALLHQISDLVTSPTRKSETWFVCLVGEAGSGKSAILSELLSQLGQEEDLVILAHSAGISSRSTSVDILLRRWIQELADFINITNPALEIADRGELQEAFAEILSRVSRDNRVVLLLDALDQFERTPAARHLTWLPVLWPANARLVATTQAGSESKALERRAGVKLIPLEPLTGDEIREIIELVCDRYHRKLHNEVIEALLTHELPSGSWAAGNPLWLRLAMEELLLLDEDDFARFGEFAGTAEQKLHSLLLTTVHGFPVDVPSLYGTLLQRTEEAFGRKWARQFAALMAVSRHGLRQTDFRTLLPRITGQPWDGLLFAALRRGFRAHLVQRGKWDQWDFSHTQARRAVMERNLPALEDRRAAHLALADHLFSLPINDPLRQSELMVHFIGGDDHLRAATHYASDLSPAEKDGATRALATHILDGTGQESNPRVDWAIALLNVKQHGEEIVQRLCQRFITELREALENDSPLSDQIALFSEVDRVLTDIRGIRTDSVEVTRSLAASQSNLGGLQRKLGNVAQSISHYEAALDLAKELHNKDPNNIEAIRNLAGSHAELADLVAQIGDYNQAQEAYERGLALIEDLCLRMPDSVEDARSLEALNGRVALLHLDRGETGQANRLAERALELAEMLQLLLPDNLHAARDLAVNYERIGTVRQKQGDRTRATEFYTQALKKREEIYRQVPDSLQAARDVWISHIKLGWLHQETGAIAHARASYDQAQKLAEELYQRAPGNALALRDLANSHHKLGVLQQETGDLLQAVAHLEKSVQLAQELHRQMPESTEASMDLTTSLHALGLLHIHSGELESAQEVFEESLELSKKLYHDLPKIIRAARALWISYNKLSGIYRECGNVETALKLSQQALEMARSQQREMPDDPQAIRDLAESLNGTALLYLNIGNTIRSKEAYEQALKLLQTLDHQKRRDSGVMLDMASCQTGMGLLYLKVSNNEQARTSYEQAVNIYQALFNQNPDDLRIANGLVTALMGAAQALGNMGHPRDAHGYLVRCHEPLRLMKASGISMHPSLDQLLEQLQAIS